MLTSHQQSILETLRLSGQPLDDDELSRRTGISPRHSVNQACRALQREGLIRRVPGAHGKLVNLLGDGAVEDEPTAAVSSGLKNALASPVTDPGLRDVEVLEVPPGNSREQREAERVMLDLLGRRRGQTLSPSRLTVPSGAEVELDGVDPDRTVLVECWAHQGRPKSAQRQKVLADALKLSWIRSTLSPPPELILCLCDPSAAAPFLPGARTWAAQALSDLDIRLEIVQLPPDVLGAVVEAQRRQYR
jgi:hypothetical protein